MNKVEEFRMKAVKSLKETGHFNKHDITKFINRITMEREEILDKFLLEYNQSKVSNEILAELYRITINLKALVLAYQELEKENISYQ